MQQHINSILDKMLIYQLKNDIRYTVSDNAPDTYERLRAECTPHNLVVWSGGSDKSN